MPEVIARRVFDRTDGQVTLSFEKPEPYPKPELDADEQDPPWRCWFTASFPDGEEQRRYAIGVDSVQALLLAFAGAKDALLYVGDGTPARRPPTKWLDTDDLGLTINHFE